MLFRKCFVSKLLWDAALQDKKIDYLFFAQNTTSTLNWHRCLQKMSLLSGLGHRPCQVILDHILDS